MDGKTTIKYLQEYIKAKDYHPELVKDYFLKLTEEVGELARSIRKDLHPSKRNEVKKIIDEELWDVIYYSLAIANCYNINMEEVIMKKEEINNKKYHNKITYDPYK